MESIGGIVAVAIVVGHDYNNIDIDDYLEMNGSTLRILAGHCQSSSPWFLSVWLPE